MVPANVVAGVAAGAAALVLSDASETLDARIVGRLDTAGVRHPRRWLAAASVASVLVGYALDRAADRASARADAQALEGVGALMRTRALTPSVREVVQGILQATDTVGAPVLLGQLAVAQESYVEEDTEWFSTIVEFQVPDEVVRVVPHDQTYPVQARCQTPEGTQLQIRLQIHEGKLAHLAIDIADETDIEDETAIEVVEEIIDRWPDPTDLRYVHEGPDGRLLPLI